MKSDIQLTSLTSSTSSTSLTPFLSDPRTKEWFGKLSKEDQELLLFLMEKTPSIEVRASQFTTRSELMRYRKMEFCGAGGMGSVYVLKDTNLGMRRAIKVVHGRDSEEEEKEHLRRILFFEKEARLLAQLDHPGIPQIMDVGYDQAGNPSYIMNLIDGDTLDVYINKMRDESVTKRLHLFFKICEIIHYAHINKIVHLDLKPDNIIVSNYGQVYVIDWGLSVEVDVDLEIQTIEGIATRSTTVMGTPEWIAPEQLLGMPASRSMDIFALGLIGLFILTGKTPRNVGENKEAIHALSVAPLTAQTLRLLKTLPVGLRNIFKDCLKNDPRQRIRSPLNVENELQHWIDYGITTRDRNGLFGYLRYQRIAHPIRYFMILYASLCIILGIVSFVAYDVWEARHLSDELNEIIESTDMTNKESRNNAIQQLRILRDHHGESGAMNQLIRSLSQ